MKRREQIRLALDRIRTTKALVAKLEDFVKLARAAGYEPVNSARTLARFEDELAGQRATLARLTIKGQEEFAHVETRLHHAGQRAA